MSFLNKLLLQIDYFNPFDDPSDVVSIDDQIAGGVNVAIAGLSIILAIMAFSAYRRSKLPQLKYVVLAFSLFTVFLAIEAAQEFLPLDDDSFDLILSIIVLLILISFFFGIMKKRKKTDS